MTLLPAVRDAKRTSAQSLRLSPNSGMGDAGKCLLVSTDTGLLDGMGRAAAKAGWNCFQCAEPEGSLRQAFLERYALGIVDIASASHRRLMKDLFRLLADSANGLIIACDRRGDPATELWARENGAWLYVPGVADWEEMSAACHEAKRIKKRLGNRDAFGAPV